MGKKILAVDDSKTMRDMVCFALKSAGHDVVEAVDGEDAMAVIGRTSGIDLVVTDLNMPRMDGIALIKAIRMHPVYRATPILILTTESDSTKKQEGKAAGATGWIVKPFVPEKLIEAVSKVCP
jgi:two-component system, chemotaxis family, chemotaxis protein CheY